MAELEDLFVEMPASEKEAVDRQGIHIKSLPVDTVRKLKVYCAYYNENMNTVVGRLIEDFLEENSVI